MMAPIDNKTIIVSFLSDILAFAFIVAVAAFAVWAGWGGLRDWMACGFY